MEEEPMSDLGFTRPDLCSIRAADEQAEFAGAVRGVLSADGYPLAGDDRHHLSPHRDLMNMVLAGVLHAFGYPVRQIGTGGAWLVAGHRGQRTGAGR
jgi:hypothetical protein